MQFERLFTPAKIAGMGLKNRIVMPPMGTCLAGADGLVTARQVDYYEERARGGAGLIIVETTYVDPLGAMPYELAADNDRVIPGLTRMAEAVHRHGARIALQLNHAGRLADSSYIHQQPVAPSAVASERDGRGIPGTVGEVPRELTIGEIADLVERFARAAARAKAAGFDGVEIHAAHGYLLARFLSRSSNRRTDAYGGILENRGRILLEVLGAVRTAVGAGYPAWCRLNGREFGTVDGLTQDEGKEVARLAAGAGADAIHVSAFGSGRVVQSPMAHPSGYLAFLAEGIKKVVSVPVIAAGRINTPEAAESILEQGKADLVAIGRALIADPEFPNKAAEGRVGDIRPCIGCQSCLGAQPVVCSVNPAAGREREFRIKPADNGKKVLVVGGGPAGMEAARVAALRGHRVTLCEKEGRLGGQLNLAAVPPHKEVIGRLRDHLAAQVKGLGIEVMLGTDATSELVQRLAPDAVVLGTGSSPYVPEIPGIERAHVVTFADVLSGRAEVGERAAIIGGELVACETAEFLADRGRRVIITTLEPELMCLGEASYLLKESLLNRLSGLGARVLTGVKYEVATGKELVLVDNKGKRQTIEFDTLVLACGARPRVELPAQLKGKVTEIRLAGDCARPRRIMEALSEGWRAAQSL